MNVDEGRRIAVVGAGPMGHGIAQGYALAMSRQGGAAWISRIPTGSRGCKGA